jgi:uncharacterized damage-inducible protein DinB
MNNKTTLGAEILKELEAEAPATRKCLERISPETFGWKPHEKSMQMVYLAVLVAEIPKWLAYMVKESEIDFATFPHLQPKTTADLVNHFDENMKNARVELEKVSDEALAGTFNLKRQGQVVFSTSKIEMMIPCVNHLVHHRGQLTVYMRLNNLPVPSIYGPSADERVF